MPDFLNIAHFGHVMVLAIVEVTAGVLTDVVSAVGACAQCDGETTVYGNECILVCVFPDSCIVQYVYFARSPVKEMGNVPMTTENNKYHHLRIDIDML